MIYEDQLWLAREFKFLRKQLEEIKKLLEAQRPMEAQRPKEKDS